MTCAILALGGCLAAVALSSSSLRADPSSPPRFVQTGSGEFTFDTGILRGRLHPGGKSLGLVSVVHVPSGTRLDSSNGLLSHYRVFTQGTRFGGGAWDWPSTATLLPDGAVVVHWTDGDRPFDFEATYRWADPSTVDLETKVRARQELRGFESFLASYFSEGFTNAAVCAKGSTIEHGGGFVSIAPEQGPWQMFPVRSDAIPLMKDGRWKLEPNPVDWTIRAPLQQPLAFRRDPLRALTVVIMGEPQSCFAIASPEQTEGHRSLYLSLVGRDLKAGEEVRARSRLQVLEAPIEARLLEKYRAFINSNSPQ